MIKFILTGIFIVGLLGLGIAIGLLITPNNNSSSQLFPVSESVNFEVTQINQLSSKTISCPTGKKLVSGSCNPDEQSSRLFLVGFQDLKSTPSLKNSDQFQCTFKAVDLGSFKYTIKALCN